MLSLVRGQFNQAPGYDPGVQKYVIPELDAGERVIAEKVASVRSVSIGFWIGAGSRDEKDDRAGVSHFIEHLLFKGSQSYDAQQIVDTFDGMGAELNAAPSREHPALDDDSPGDLVHYLFSQAVFGAHALGRPVIGTAEVISTVSRRAVA